MVYGYIRVSTDRQTVENQRFEIKNFCKKEALKVDSWIEETISWYHTLPGMMLARTYQIRTSLYTSCQLFLGQYESHQYR